MFQGTDPSPLSPTPLHEGPTYPRDQTADFKRGLILMGKRDFVFIYYIATDNVCVCLLVFVPADLYIVRGWGIEVFMSCLTHDNYTRVGVLCSCEYELDVMWYLCFCGCESDMIWYLYLCGYENGMVVMLLCKSHFFCRFETVNRIFILCVWEWWYDSYCIVGTNIMM